MALPQNPDGLTAGDRALLSASLEQTNKLKAQTKVLEKLTDAISKQQKEYGNLRKDIQDSQKKLFEGNGKGFSEIRKYFQKQQTPGFSSRSKIGDKDSEQKGFFKNAMNKLFGQSKYQQKMMDDTTAIRDISELTRADISFIKRQYEDPARAKERELLAQAIADKINIAGSDSEGGGGFLSKLGLGLASILAAAFSAGIALFSGALKTLFKVLLDKIVLGIGLAIEKIVQGIAASITRIFGLLGDLWEKIKSWRSSPATTTPASASPGITPSATPVPAGQPMGGNPALAGPETPRIAGPGGTAAPSSIPKPEQLFQNKQGLYVTASELAATEGMAARLSSTLGTIFKGLVLLQALITPLVTSEEEIKIVKAAVAKRAAETARRTFAATDERRFDMMSKDKAASGLVQQDDEQWKGWDTGEKSVMDVIKDKMLDILTKVEDYVEEEIGNKFATASKNWLDQVGELDINGEKINLLPNLGTATASVLNSIAQESIDLLLKSKEFAEPAGNYITNQVNNVVNGGGAQSQIVLPSAPSVNTRPEIQQMLMGGVVIGGRRYF